MQVFKYPRAVVSGSISSAAGRLFRPFGRRPDGRGPVGRAGRILPSGTDGGRSYLGKTARYQRQSCFGFKLVPLNMKGWSYSIALSAPLLTSACPAHCRKTGDQQALWYARASLTPTKQCRRISVFQSHDCACGMKLLIATCEKREVDGA